MCEHGQVAVNMKLLDIVLMSNAEDGGDDDNADASADRVAGGRAP